KSPAYGSTPDFFMDQQHPGAIASGLFANMVVEALDGSYGYNIDPLTDQEILQNAGLGPQASDPTYFDVTQFVHNVDHAAPTSTHVSIQGQAGRNVVTLSASDNRFGSGVSALQYSLDGGQTWLNATSTGTAPFPGAPYGADVTHGF